MPTSQNTTDREPEGLLPDYSRVFKRLCHVAALSKHGKITQCVESLVLAVLSIDPKLEAAEPKAVLGVKRHVSSAM